MEEYVNLAAGSGVNDGVEGDEFFIEEGEDLDELKKRTPDLVRKQLFKTKMCPFHQESRCQRGADCTFAHSDMELRPLPDLRNTRLCRRVRIGQNCDDPLCPFAHARCDLRTTDMRLFKVRLCNFNRKGKCLNGDHCRFAHGTNELRGSTGSTTGKQRGDTAGGVDRGSVSGGGVDDAFDDDDEFSKFGGSTAEGVVGGIGGNAVGSINGVGRIGKIASGNATANRTSNATTGGTGGAGGNGRVGDHLRYNNNNKIISGVGAGGKGIDDDENNRLYTAMQQTNSNNIHKSNMDNSYFFNEVVKDGTTSFGDMDASTNNSCILSEGLGVGSGQTLGVSTQGINNNIQHNAGSSSLLSMQNSCTPSNVMEYGHNNMHMDQALLSQINATTMNQRGVHTAVRLQNNADQSSSQDSAVFMNQFAPPQSRFCFSNMSNVPTANIGGMVHKNNNSIANMNLNNTNNNSQIGGNNNANSALTGTNTNSFHMGVDTLINQAATNFTANQQMNIMPSTSIHHPQQQHAQTSQLRASAPSYSPQIPLTTPYTSPHQHQSRAFYGVQQQNSIDNTAASLQQGGASMLPNYPDYSTDSLSPQCDMSSYTLYGTNNGRNISSSNLSHTGGAGGGGMRSIDDTTQLMQHHVDIYSQHAAVQQHYMTTQPTMQQQMMNAHSNIVNPNLSVSSLGGHSSIPPSAFSSADVNGRGINTSNSGGAGGGGMQQLGGGCVETSSMGVHASRYGGPTSTGRLSLMDESQSMNMFPTHPHPHSMYDINAHHQSRMPTPISADPWNCMNRDAMMRGGGNTGEGDMYAQQQSVNVYHHQPMQQTSNHNSHTSFHQALHQPQAPPSQTIRINSAGVDYMDNSGIVAQQSVAHGGGGGRAGSGGGMDQNYGGIGGGGISNDMRMSFLSSQQMQQQQSNDGTQQPQNSHGSITPSNGMYDDTSFHQGVSEAVYTSAYSDFMSPVGPPPPVCPTVLSGAVYHPPIPTISPYMQHQHVSPTTTQSPQNILGGGGGGTMTRSFEYSQIQHNNNNNLSGCFSSSNLQQQQMMHCHANSNNNNNDLSANTAVSSIPNTSTNLNVVNSNSYLSINGPTQMPSFYNNTNGNNMINNNNNTTNTTGCIGGMVNTGVGNGSMSGVNSKYDGDFSMNNNSGNNFSVYTNTANTTQARFNNNSNTYDHSSNIIHNNNANNNGNQYYQNKLLLATQQYSAPPIHPICSTSSSNTSVTLSSSIAVSTSSCNNSSTSVAPPSSSCVEKMNTTQHAYTPNSDVGTSPTYAPHSPSSVDSQTTRHSETLSQLTPLSNVNNVHNNKLNNKNSNDNNNSRNKSISSNKIGTNNNDKSSNANTLKSNSNISIKNVALSTTTTTSNTNMPIRTSNMTYGISNSVVSSPNTRAQKHNHAALIRRLSSGDNHLDILSNNLSNTNARTPISQVFAFSSFDLGLNNSNNENGNSEIPNDSNSNDSVTSDGNNNSNMSYAASSSNPIITNEHIIAS